MKLTKPGYYTPPKDHIPSHRNPVVCALLKTPKRGQCVHDDRREAAEAKWAQQQMEEEAEQHELYDAGE